MIIGICGFIGSGKDTVAEYLVNTRGFIRESYAGTLKDAVSNVFGWNRDWLEGLTPEAREWREQVDPWWSVRLDIPHLTPRWVLQQWGTDVARKSFHNDIWIASLENKLRDNKNNVVISDCRFPNEIKSIKKQGGIVVWVKRGELPEWYELARECNIYNTPEIMQKHYPNVHHSEWAWIGSNFNEIFDNNDSLEQLYQKVDTLINSYEQIDFVRRIALDEI